MYKCHISSPSTWRDNVAWTLKFDPSLFLFFFSLLARRGRESNKCENIEPPSVRSHFTIKSNLIPSLSFSLFLSQPLSFFFPSPPSLKQTYHNHNQNGSVRCPWLPPYRYWSISQEGESEILIKRAQKLAPLPHSFPSSSALPPTALQPCCLSWIQRG